MPYHVNSEVGTLRQVILHRPDLELKRLTPSNKAELLFDDILWVKRARQEHDAFADVPRDEGLEVHLFDELLRETVAFPEAKRHILDAVFDERVYGPMAIDPLRNLFDAMDDDDLTVYLIGGMSKAGRHPASLRRLSASCRRGELRHGGSAVQIDPRSGRGPWKTYAGVYTRRALSWRILRATASGIWVIVSWM